MKKLRDEDYVFYLGEKFQVEFYFTEKGDLPAKNYLKKDYELRVKEGRYYEN